MDALYSLSGVKLTYGERTVLDIDELTISRSKATCLLGPNGSGKSTLLGILALLNKPSRGSVRCRGKAVDFGDKGMLHTLRQELVLVDQHPVLFSTSVYGNVEYGLRVRGVPASDRKKRCGKALERVGLSHLVGRKSHKLSGGETQRIALARALALKPKVMLIDEPTASVDAEHQLVIESIMSDIVAAGESAIIFSTHDARLADTLAGERVLLESGKLCRESRENFLSVHVMEGAGGRKQCMLGSVPLAFIETEAIGPQRISLDMSKVILNPNGNALPKGSRITGRVLQMVDLDEFVRIHLDIGARIELIVAKEEVRRRCFFVGDEVQAFIPDDAVRAV